MNHQTRTTLRWGLPILAALALGAGLFFGVRTLSGEGPDANAQLEPEWWVSYFNQDAQKPRFDKSLNGIRVGPTADAPSPSACRNAPAEYASPDAAVGTELDISPSYLPAGVQFRSGEAVKCGDVLVSLLEEYDVPSKLDSKNPNVPIWSGGTFSIFRISTAVKTFPLDGAAERLAPVSVKGKTAVLMRPVTPGGVDAGMGNAAIIISEPFGLTAIQGSGLPLSEFIKIAEGMN